MKGYGKILVKLRGKRTQEEVARDLGIATSTLAMYETEKRVPRDSIKVLIAEYYKTPVQKIFFCEKCHEKGQNSIENKESMHGIFLVEMPMEYFLEDEEV